MTMPVRVSDHAPEGWDAYVHAHALASPYHLAAAVEIGRRVFGFRCYFLTAHRADGGIAGVLPLAEQAGLWGQRTLVSLPFFNYGGVLADDAAGADALTEESVRLAQSRGVKQVELRHADDIAAGSWLLRLDKISMLLELPATVEELGKRLGSKLRSQIKRAEREQPEVAVGGAELLGEFYPVFCSVMRDLGTPVYARRFFDDVFACLGTRAQVVVLRVRGKAVSGAVLVRWRDGMEIPWAATLSDFRATAINMRLYWEVLQLCVVQGCRRFDFGRSTRGSGPHRFKEQWGAKPLQLHWRKWGVQEEVDAAAPAGASLGLAVKVWSRLPLPVANWLGPMISPRLPW
jgi:FemAB-related protein (PEP-CTERM system-associated)